MRLGVRVAAAVVVVAVGAGVSGCGRLGQAGGVPSPAPSSVVATEGAVATSAPREQADVDELEQLLRDADRAADAADRLADDADGDLAQGDSP